jgi:hypothetical protein
MKIGIFGDSWGDVRYSYRLQKDQDPWVVILDKKYNITNFCEAGSGVYFSTEKFLEHYKDFDKVIFLVSDCARRYLPERSGIQSGPEILRHIKFNSPEMLRKSVEQTPRNKEIQLAIELYYRHLENDKQDKYCHQLILNDIQSKLPADKLLMLEHCYDISKKEDMYYQSIGHDLTLFYEWKNCHMTYTNNQRMAELLDQWLTDPESIKLTIGNSRSINYELFHDPIGEPFEKYYKRID